MSVSDLEIRLNFVAIEDDEAKDDNDDDDDDDDDGNDASASRAGSAGGSGSEGEGRRQCARMRSMGTP